MDAQDQADTSSVNASADVLARLRRLEEIVLGRRSASVPLEQPSSETFSLPPISVRTEEHPYVDPQEQSSTATVDWLEGKVTSPGSLVGLSTRVKTISKRDQLTDIQRTVF